MKIFKIKTGVLIEREEEYFLNREMSWDQIFREDNQRLFLDSLIKKSSRVNEASSVIEHESEAPVQNQEIWAAGVTYFNSKLGRQEESKNSGGGQFYAHVYEADRPELFFKSTAYRTVGPGGKVRIRKDSSWNVPEPELTLAISSSGKIFGYTIGNDMSSRSIEGENPLYLPQAKTYDGCAALGPCIYVSDQTLDSSTEIKLLINRKGKIAFEGKVLLDQMKRKPVELVPWLFRENTFPDGCFLMTGTGIVPSSEFTLLSGDEIRITIEPIGTLSNFVA
jgi:2-dehydro-3-deoxy-D-arabinonate dehydratase